MKETWQFSDDLTYEHKIERYESAITTGPFFQSSYSQPQISLERSIWAPPDTTLDELTLFVMSGDAFARSIRFNGSKRKRITTDLARLTMRFSRE